MSKKKKERKRRREGERFTLGIQRADLPSCVTCQIASPLYLRIIRVRRKKSYFIFMCGLVYEFIQYTTTQ